MIRTFGSSFGTQSSIAAVAAQLRARESARKMGDEGVGEEEEEEEVGA